MAAQRVKQQRVTVVPVAEYPRCYGPGSSGAITLSTGGASGSSGDIADDGRATGGWLALCMSLLVQVCVALAPRRSLAVNRPLGWWLAVLRGGYSVQASSSDVSLFTMNAGSGSSSSLSISTGTSTDGNSGAIEISTGQSSSAAGGKFTVAVGSSQVGSGACQHYGWDNRGRFCKRRLCERYESDADTGSGGSASISAGASTAGRRCSDQVAPARPHLRRYPVAECCGNAGASGALSLSTGATTNGATGAVTIVTGDAAAGGAGEPSLSRSVKRTRSRAVISPWLQVDQHSPRAGR